MRSFLAALRSLVLPYGQTTGPRIFLDGVNGVIQVFDADGEIMRIDSQGVFVLQDGQVTLQSPDGKSLSLLNGGTLEPEILFVGSNNSTGFISFDTPSSPEGFNMWIGNGSGALNANTDYWWFAGNTAGQGVLFDPTTSDFRKRIGNAAETWHAATLSNGWANVVGLDVLAVRKQPDDFVLFQGIIGSGTVADGTIVATIPAGYRPAKAKAFSVAAAGTSNPRARVNTDGTIQIFGGVTAGQSISFEGCGYSLT
jgi:hypothetical protein